MAASWYGFISPHWACVISKRSSHRRSRAVCSACCLALSGGTQEMICRVVKLRLRRAGRALSGDGFSAFALRYLALLLLPDVGAEPAAAPSITSGDTAATAGD